MNEQIQVQVTVYAVKERDIKGMEDCLREMARTAAREAVVLLQLFQGGGWIRVTDFGQSK